MGAGFLWVWTVHFHVYQSLYENIKETHNLVVIDNPMQDYCDDIRPQDFANYVEELLKTNKVSSFQSVSFSMGSPIKFILTYFFW